MRIKFNRDPRLNPRRLDPLEGRERFVAASFQLAIDATVAADADADADADVDVETETETGTGTGTGAGAGAGAGAKKGPRVAAGPRSCPDAGSGRREPCFSRRPTATVDSRLR